MHRVLNHIAIAIVSLTAACQGMPFLSGSKAATPAMAGVPSATGGVCPARDVADGRRHALIAEVPPVAKTPGAKINPAGTGTAAYLYAAIAQARGEAGTGAELIGGVPAPLVHLIEARAANEDVTWCRTTVHDLQAESTRFDAAWKTFAARRAEVERALHAAEHAAPAAAEQILWGVITPAAVDAQGQIIATDRAPLEPIDAETDAILALAPVLRQSGHFALYGDLVRGLAVRRRASAGTQAELDERVLWLLAREPNLHAWADGALSATKRHEYVQAMNLVRDRLRESRAFGAAIALGLRLRRSAFDVKYVDVLDTASAKPGDLVVVRLDHEVQTTDKSVVLDLTNKWNEAYDCHPTAQVCGWDWDGGSYHAAFCQECKYRQIQAHLYVSLALSAPPPDWARGGHGRTLIARVGSVKKKGATEAAWRFTDAQFVDDRFVDAPTEVSFR